MPKTWIVEDEPDPKQAQKDEEAKFKAKKMKKYVEEIKHVEPEPYEEVKAQVQIPVDNTQAMQNMDQGFDPLGGRKFTPNDVPDDNDLLGWNK